jgi:hypothetical protein
MPRKLVENLEVGMVVSQDLHDANGSLLLPAGTALNAQHIRVLRHWRVSVVNVDGPLGEELQWFNTNLDDLTDAQHITNEKRLQELFLYCRLDQLFVSRFFYYLLDRADRMAVAKAHKP